MSSGGRIGACDLRGYEDRCTVIDVLQVPWLAGYVILSNHCLGMSASPPRQRCTTEARTAFRGGPRLCVHGQRSCLARCTGAGFGGKRSPYPIDVGDPLPRKQPPSRRNILPGDGETARPA